MRVVATTGDSIVRRRMYPSIRLGDLLAQQRRECAVQPDVEYDLLGAHWYAKGLYVKERKPGSQIKARKLYRVSPGDFVYNRLFAWKGSFAVAGDDVNACYVSNEFPCFEVDANRLDAHYLWWYFSRQCAWDEALRSSYGATPTSRNRLKERHLLDMSLVLPPLEEQRRIVAKIKQLAAKIDEARGLRERTTATASALVPARITEIFDELTEDASFPLRTLGENGSNPIQTGPFGAQLKKLEFVGEGVPVLNVGNVWPEGIRFDRLDHVTREKAAQLARYELAANDLLFARSGATLGKVCVLPDRCDGWLMTGHLFRVRFDQTRCLPYFAFAALRGARSVRAQVFDQVRGATRPGFNTTLLGNVALPLPPLEEQHRIVGYLDGIQAKVDRLKALQEKTAAELDALLPAILDKAFKGEL